MAIEEVSEPSCAHEEEAGNTNMRPPEEVAGVGPIASFSQQCEHEHRYGEHTPSQHDSAVPKCSFAKDQHEHVLDTHVYTHPLENFFEPVLRPADGTCTIRPGEFYIFATKENG